MIRIFYDSEYIKAEDTKSKNIIPVYSDSYGDEFGIIFDDGTVVKVCDGKLTVLKKGNAFISYGDNSVFIGKTFKYFSVGDLTERFW